MKKLIVLLFVGFVALSTFAADPKPSTPTANAAATFDRLKGLVGDWQATTNMGKVTAHYELVSDGHVLLEHLDMPGMHQDMVTAYYLDGDKVGLTHYCGLGNQPRMQASGIAGDGSIRFQFVSAANLASGEDKHMHTVNVRLIDNDHFTADWTMFDQSKPAMDVTLQYVRVK